MSVKTWLTLSKSSPILATMALMVGMITGQAKAEDFNTGYVLNKMPSKERLVHIDGVVRGVAYAQYFNHNKSNSIFDCIHEYTLTSDGTNWDNMLEFAKQFPDKPLGGVLFVYLRKQCGG